MAKRKIVTQNKNDAAMRPPERERLGEEHQTVAQIQDAAQAQRDAFRRWMEICLPGVDGHDPAVAVDRPSPASEPVVENGEPVDQKERDRVQRIAAALRAQGHRFARQGTVVATWRQYRGKRLGPYYRLAYRADGRQKSIYLGASAWVAAQIRRLLARLQAPLREHRALQRARATILASLRRHQARAKALFAAVGVRLKGFEYRGLLGHLRDLTRQREASLHAHRTAAAWQVIIGAG